MDCLFRSLSGIGLRNTVLDKFAFEQPAQPNYSFSLEGGKLKMMTLSDPKNEKSPHIKAEEFLKDTPHISLDVHEVNKDKDKHVNLLHLKNTKNSTKMTIMYCHGNSSCLGKLYPSMIDICKSADVDMIAVEYPGYGTIKGTPTDSNVIQNVMTAYNYVTQSLKLDPNTLIVYGQSLGCGPAVFLSSHPDFPTAGLITEGAFSSGLRTFNKDRKLLWDKDFFPSSYYMGFVQCPVYIMHSTDDERIPFANAKMMVDASPHNYPPYFPTKGGHNDIKEMNHDEYYANLKKFIRHCADLSKKIDKEKFVQKFRGRLMKGVPHFYLDQFPPVFNAQFAKEKWPGDLFYKREKLDDEESMDMVENDGK